MRSRLKCVSFCTTTGGIPSEVRKFSELSAVRQNSGINEAGLSTTTQGRTDTEKQPYEYINSRARKENPTKKDTRLRTHILNRHWRTGDRRWTRTALRSPFLTRNIGELPVSRSSFPLLLDDSDEIAVWILWLELLFSTVCAKG